MRKELEKNYNPLDAEERIYKKWLDKGYFHAEIDHNKKKFSIMIPPPNITNRLHLGHSFEQTQQDILTRFKRMKGFSALWLPGTDHASISTEVLIVKKLAEEGSSKAELGREKFLERAWDWKREYGGAIINQLKKLGSSCDWERERFTLDPMLTKATKTVFKNLYDSGLIYRGLKLVNWCPVCKTTISDAEVEHVPQNGLYYHMKYKINGTDTYLAFVTSRPETILGDTAIAVHPKDERYKHLVGKTVIVPVVNREIPIIADEYVDREFGTGVVKITPAHDPNDFEVGERHNLPKINVLNDNGTINENGGKFEGLDRYEARKRIVEEFKQLGLFIKTEEMNNSVGEHERCHTVVEPILKTQWFVKMEELARPAAEAAKTGELRFHPERYRKIYLNWLNGIRDWCISRQLWWGHRIPAWHCDDCGHITVSVDDVSVCEKCSSAKVHQDEDCLDTWFSSALWPFATLGWPDKTPDFEYFFPTDVMICGYDILFFWIIRMVFSSLKQTGKLPFFDVVPHGLIRDKLGRKFSKSLNNGIDPIEVINQYGADALRLTLITGNSPGNDMRFYPERVEVSRNFLNKLWNAARFLLMNFDDSEPVLDETKLTRADKWVLSRINSVAKEVNTQLEAFDFGIAVSEIYNFVWDEFCDWYIEMVKPRLYNRDDETREVALWTLKTVFTDALKLLHPFMPFITEELFLSLQDSEETIMRSVFPEYSEERNFPQEEKAIDSVKEAIKSIRAIRTQMNVPPSRKAKLKFVCEKEEFAEIFSQGESFLKTLAHSSEVEIALSGTGNETDVSVIAPGAVIYIPLADLIDIEKEKERLNKEKEKLIKEVERVRGKLSNDGFIKKAPAALIDEEKQKLEKYSEMLSKTEEQLNNLK
ncbi:MAG: valine--tRNA ligase [Clostridiales bacterium]|jgi:valyl-tRNA synthetase|nr:valine--tRNA ligase [Clostridiales bacterium]